jgi:hypothetical protein
MTSYNIIWGAMSTNTVGYVGAVIWALQNGKCGQMGSKKSYKKRKGNWSS